MFTNEASRHVSAPPDFRLLSLVVSVKGWRSDRATITSEISPRDNSPPTEPLPLQQCRQPVRLLVSIAYHCDACQQLTDHQLSAQQ